MSLPILLAALFAITPITASAAIFDDGNDRKFVKDLRGKNPASLTGEEKAVLAAANKVGLIGLCNRKKRGNAVLILYRGRPAILTAAHFAVDPKNGGLLCPSEADLVKGMGYLPNFSFYDTTRATRIDFLLRKVGLEFPPANWARVKGVPFKPEEDFLVFYLQEDITRDRMPDGSIRGYLKFSETPPAKGNLYMLGLTGDMGGGMDMVYQAHCDGFMTGKRFYHGCDSLNGSSASLIGILENGDITFRGVHNAGDEIRDLPASARTDPMKANIANSSTEISVLMTRESGRSSFLASDLQWLLTRAGCHSGKLDNQWGPGSRKALEAFAGAAGITLPGTEPSADLLTAVEKAAREGKVVCQ